MGLISGLLTLPLAPVKGVAWVGEQVAEEADRELYDEGRIRRELADLDRRADEGLISDEERAYEEERLMERLAVVHERRREEQEARADG